MNQNLPPIHPQETHLVQPIPPPSISLVEQKLHLSNPSGNQQDAQPDEVNGQTEQFEPQQMENEQWPAEEGQGQQGQEWQVGGEEQEGGEQEGREQEGGEEQEGERIELVEGEDDPVDGFDEVGQREQLAVEDEKEQEQFSEEVIAMDKEMQKDTIEAGEADAQDFCDYAEYFPDSQDKSDAQSQHPEQNLATPIITSGLLLEPTSIELPVEPEAPVIIQPIVEVHAPIIQEVIMSKPVESIAEMRKPVESIAQKYPVFVAQPVVSVPEIEQEKKPKKQKKSKKDKKKLKDTQQNSAPVEPLQVSAQVPHLAVQVIPPPVIPPPVIPPPPVILSNATVIREAQRERLGTTLALFRKYVTAHTKTVYSHCSVIKNICGELTRRTLHKQVLLKVLSDYFIDLARTTGKMHEFTSQPQVENNSGSNNTFINMRSEFREGLALLGDLRKRVGSELNTLGIHITSQLMTSLNSSFNLYFSTVGAAQAQQTSKHDTHALNFKQFVKKREKLESLLLKSMEGSKVSDDIFVETSRLICDEAEYRKSLIEWGKGLLQLRQTHIAAQERLFESLQKLLNQLKTKSKGIYSVEKDFNGIVTMRKPILEEYRFAKLCTLVDIDFVQYMLEVQQRKETTSFQDEHLEEYLELRFFDKTVGTLGSLLKGTTSKAFQLQQPQEELVHTISGNFVHFDRRSNICKDKMPLAAINTKLLGESLIEFEELKKGWIFSERRLSRIKLKDRDRAEQVICYLLEKKAEGTQ